MSKLLTKYFNLGSKGVIIFVIIGYMKIKLLILVYNPYYLYFFCSHHQLILTLIYFRVRGLLQQEGGLSAPVLYEDPKHDW